jgi:hypothetical protein
MGINWRQSAEIKTLAYDPAEDPDKIMRGEVESYFD